MRFSKVISFILVFSVICGLFCGCGRDYSDNYIYFDISNKPTSLDPQTASTDEELLIVRNIFEGLLRKNENGEIVCGAAKSYEKSGNVYTFELREDASWSDGTPLTANDFVFGFKRAVTPNVKAIFVNRLFSIKNAKEIYLGKMNSSQLGVRAINDYSLEITLSHDDNKFLDTLSTSIAMPCNENFFKSTVGKYGLEADYVLSNGSYFLKKWNPDDFGIRLYKNEKYNGDFVAKNGAVFISSKEDETPVQFFEKGSVDCAIVKSKYLNDVERIGITKTSYQNTVWFLTINSNFDSRVRNAFVKAFSSDIYKDKLPEGFQSATSIYPGIITNEKSSGTITPYNRYDIEGAKSLFSTAIKEMENDQFPSSSLYMAENESVFPAVKAILGHWQNNLCAFINVTSPNHPDELIGQLKEKTVDFAVFSVTAKSNDYNEYLINFGKEGTEMITANTQLLSDNTLIPIAFEDTNICYSSLIENLYTDSENGYIDFSFAIKKD